VNSSVLTFVVIGQIAVFQFLSVGFARSLFTAHLGKLPEPLGSKAAAYLDKARRYRFGLGLVLLLLALASLLGLPPDPQARKLLLVVVSLTSSAAFAFASVSDRRAVRAMRKALPEAGVRRASLQPRSASHWYPSAWEILPIAILVTTVVLAIALGRRLGHIATEMWVLQFLQAAFVIGALLYTSRYGVAVPNVSSRLAMLRDHPEVALEFGERLAAREMRYFMLAKIGVALLLGVSTVEAGLKALDHEAASLLGAVSWVIVGVLLVMFVTFVLQIVTLTKHMQNQIQRHEHEVNEGR
jgi:hypothetical protein